MGVVLGFDLSSGKYRVVYNDGDKRMHTRAELMRRFGASTIDLKDAYSAQQNELEEDFARARSENGLHGADVVGKFSLLF